MWRICSRADPPLPKQTVHLARDRRAILRQDCEGGAPKRQKAPGDLPRLGRGRGGQAEAAQGLHQGLPRCRLGAGGSDPAASGRQGAGGRSRPAGCRPGCSLQAPGLWADQGAGPGAAVAAGRLGPPRRTARRVGLGAATRPRALSGVTRSRAAAEGHRPQRRVASARQTMTGHTAPPEVPGVATGPGTEAAHLAQACQAGRGTVQAGW